MAQIEPEQVLLDPPQVSVPVALNPTTEFGKAYAQRDAAVTALKALMNHAVDRSGHTFTVTISADGSTATATDVTGD